MPSPSQVFGQSAENLAEHLLRQKGYRILQRNFCVAGGELDLVAQDHDVLVFVEVKARRSPRLGGASYAITNRKKQQIIKLASCYLSQHGLSNQSCRFDAILIDAINQQSTQCTHIEHAFEVSSSDWQW